MNLLQINMMRQYIKDCNEIGIIDNNITDKKLQKLNFFENEIYKQMNNLNEQKLDNNNEIDNDNNSLNIDNDNDNDLVSNIINNE